MSLYTPCYPTEQKVNKDRQVMRSSSSTQILLLWKHCSPSRRNVDRSISQLIVASKTSHVGVGWCGCWSSGCSFSSSWLREPSVNRKENYNRLWALHSELIKFDFRLVRLGTFAPLPYNCTTLSSTIVPQKLVSWTWIFRSLQNFFSFTQFHLRTGNARPQNTKIKK